MACYHPIPAWQHPTGGPLKLWPPVGTATLKIPCGTCLGCVTDHATQWAHRAELEATAWAHNCFLTLTYDDEHLPENGHLRPKHVTDFLKRLRRRLDRPGAAIAWDPISKPRYLYSGEYGEKTLRPHYHILLFNAAPTDAHRVGKGLWESPQITKLWQKGGHRIGELTGASANYVAQYTLKKLVTPVDEHDENGEVYKPPFIRMSLKPPLGQKWTEKYKEDLQHGYLIRNARKNKIPRAMMKQLTKLDPQLADTAAQAAQQHKHKHQDLQAAEKIHQAKNALFNNRPL